MYPDVPGCVLYHIIEANVSTGATVLMTALSLHWSEVV